MSKAGFVTGWIASSVAAVLLGVGIATLLLAHSMAVVLAVAALEGLCLGGIQQLILRQSNKGQAANWLLATVAGALLGRAAEFLCDTSTQASIVSEWSPVAQAVAVAGLGLVVGMIMAVPQYFVLRRHAPQAWRWLLVRGGAWALGLVVLFAAANPLASIGNTPPIVAILAVASVFAAIAAIVGVLEGFGLAAILRIESPVQRARTSRAITV
jgi:hypothetical protein